VTGVQTCALPISSRDEVGQVYVPAVNWGIFVAVVALVIGFGSAERLASAYPKPITRATTATKIPQLTAGT